MAEMLDELEIEEPQLDYDVIIEEEELTIETGELAIGGKRLTIGDEGHTVGDEVISVEDEVISVEDEEISVGDEVISFGDEELTGEDESIRIEDEGLTNAFKESKRRRSFLPLLKEELRMKIQVKRLSEGKDELQIKVEEPPIYELTEEEKEKISYRRAQNRKASERKRQRDRYNEEKFKKIIDLLTVQNNKLSRLKSKLQRSKASLLERLSRYKDCKCGKQTAYSAHVTLIKPIPVTKPERSDVTYHVLPSGSKYHTTCYTTNNSSNSITATPSLLPKPVQAMHFQNGKLAMSKPISCHFSNTEKEYKSTDYNVVPVTQTKDSVTLVKPLSTNDHIYNVPLIVSSKLKTQDAGHGNNDLYKNKTAETDVNKGVNGVKNTRIYSQGKKLFDTTSDQTLTEKERQLLNDISDVIKNDREITPKLNIPNTVFDLL